MLITQSFSCRGPFGVTEAEFVRTTFIYPLNRRFIILIMSLAADVFLFDPLPIDARSYGDGP
jgi:hypothetical protein